MQGPSCQTPGARPHQEAPGRCSEGQAGRLPPSRTQKDASYTSYIDSATLTCSSMTHTLNWLPTDGQDRLLWLRVRKHCQLWPQKEPQSWPRQCSYLTSQSRWGLLHFSLGELGVL